MNDLTFWSEEEETVKFTLTFYRDTPHSRIWVISCQEMTLDQWGFTASKWRICRAHFYRRTRLSKQIHWTLLFVTVWKLMPAAARYIDCRNGCFILHSTCSHGRSCIGTHVAGRLTTRFDRFDRFDSLRISRSFCLNEKGHSAGHSGG